MIVAAEEVVVAILLIICSFKEVLQKEQPTKPPTADMSEYQLTPVALGARRLKKNPISISPFRNLLYRRGGMMAHMWVGTTLSPTSWNFLRPVDMTGIEQIVPLRMERYSHMGGGLTLIQCKTGLLIKSGQSIGLRSDPPYDRLSDFVRLSISKWHTILLQPCANIGNFNPENCPDAPAVHILYNSWITCFTAMSDTNPWQPLARHGTWK